MINNHLRRALRIGALLLSAATVGGVATFAIVRLSFDPKPLTSGFEETDRIPPEWQVDAGAECEMTPSALQARDGTQSLRVRAPIGGRCEIVPIVFPKYVDKLLREPFGVDRWYRFSVYVEEMNTGAAENLGDNTVIAQWHASGDPFFPNEGGRGPPLALRIHDGIWWITYGWDSDFASKDRSLSNSWHKIGPVESRQWIDWTFHVVWSYGNDGLTEIWRGDELILQRSGPNAYNDLRGVYLKLGLYHPVDAATIFLDRVDVVDRVN